MRRADRLFQIVQHLRGGRLLTAGVLAERLEVSPRTIYRDIADLQGSGVPIEGEAGVGYVMASGYQMPPLMFTRDEVAALVVGARLARAFGGASTARAAEEALVKIEAVLPQDLQSRAGTVAVHAVATDISAELRSRLDALEHAAENRIRLQISYRDETGAETQRALRPLGLWFWGKVWTLVGWCELREDFRMFRIDRIADWAQAGTFRAERDKSLQAFYRKEERTGREAKRPRPDQLQG
ncbi:MAG: putative DNA-binding transcriptional regulator YafY [Dinoroseobacter sp.]|jgi:predicted DNA-binding transcriptional regulator YafY